MGFESGWANSSDVVRNHYGARTIKDFGGQVSTNALDKEVSIVFDYDDLPVNGLGDMEALIPAGSLIKSAHIEVLTAMAGTVGTLTIGLEEPDGTVIDVDGIDVAVAQAALVADAWIVCDGALIGAGIAEPAQILVTTGGTVTAGRFKVVIQYQLGDVDGTGNYTAGGVMGAG